MEKRLAAVKAQEDEVRAIANAHLQREAELKKLLEDLFVQHRVSAHLRLTYCTVLSYTVFCLQD